MSEQIVCKVCGFPLDQHSVELRWGVAQAIVRGPDGKRLWACSEATNDYNDFRGQISTLGTMVRSLRWRAGRLRSKQAHWQDYDLDLWANKLERDIQRLRKLVVEHYGWSQD